MKQASLIILLTLFFITGFSQRTVHVRGYTKKNGTYVSPYTRTAPDNTITNNYSYPGNYNPNKGSFTTGSASRYLRKQSRQYRRYQRQMRRD